MGATLGLVAGLIGLAAFALWIAVRAAKAEGQADAKNEDLEAAHRSREAFDDTFARGRLSGRALVSRLRRIASRKRASLPDNGPESD